MERFFVARPGTTYKHDADADAMCVCGARRGGDSSRVLLFNLSRGVHESPSTFRASRHDSDLLPFFRDFATKCRESVFVSVPETMHMCSHVCAVVGSAEEGMVWCLTKI